MARCSAAASRDLPECAAEVPAALLFWSYAHVCRLCRWQQSGLQVAAQPQHANKGRAGGPRQNAAGSFLNPELCFVNPCFVNPCFVKLVS